MLSAASLASTGEFSLVIIGKAGGYRPFDPGVEQMLLACTAITMAVVPSMMRGASPFAKWLGRKGILSTRKQVPEAMTPTQAIKDLTDHAIICGYGPVGKALNAALKRCGVDTLVMELNSDTIRALKQEGQLALFADASHSEALDLAGIKQARLVAFTFPSVRTTCIAVPLVRQRNSEIFIFWQGEIFR